VPAESLDVLKLGEVLNHPSRLDFQTYLAILPSGSEPVPLKETELPTFAGLGEMEVILTTGL
jgi:hypothetical protein